MDLDITEKDNRKVVINKILEKQGYETFDTTIYFKDGSWMDDKIKIRGVKDLIKNAIPTKNIRGNLDLIIPWLKFINEYEVEPGCYFIDEVVINNMIGRPNILPPNFKNTIKSCKTNFFIIPVTIVEKHEVINGIRYRVGHQNIVIINKKMKTVERFEPNGVFPKFDFVDAIFKKEFAKQLKYIPPLQYCPTLGPQTLQKQLDKGGFCVTWSTLYMHLRLRNPDIDAETIVDYLTSFSPEELLDIIQKYQYLIETTVKASF